MANRTFSDYLLNSVPEIGAVDNQDYLVAYDAQTAAPRKAKVAALSGLQTKIMISVKDYGAVGNGIVDDSAAFSAMWAAIKAAKVTVTEPYVTVTAVIPPGVYSIGTSINWTDLNAYNVTITGYGAVLLGKVTGGHVIDMTGVLGTHVKGLMIVGDSVSTPMSGIFIGPIGTATCGINSFQDIKCTGNYSVASVWNHGSETTEWNGCRFANSFPGAETYGYLGDCLNRFNGTSAYKTVRAANTAVSFTANSFKHCTIRNWSTTSLGGSIYIEGTNAWLFDKTCYFLAFAGANVRIRNDSAYRTVGLALAGLFETSQAPGVDYCVEFLVSNGIATGAFDLNFDFTAPLAKSAIIKVTAPGGGATTGTIVATGTIRMSSPTIALVKLFDAPTMTFNGDIHCRTASSINFSFVAGLSGSLYVDNKSSMVMPVGANTNKLAIYDTTSGSVAFHSQKTVYHCMNNSDVAGGLTFSRSLGQADRSSELEVLNSATQALNYIKLLVHNGTVGTKYATLSAYGDGRVQIGDSAISNVLRIEPSVNGTGDVVIKTFGLATNINMSFEPKGTGNVVMQLSSVPNYADDAAAATGGVVVGGIYRTGSALKIRAV